jgi:hypothetical protein
MSQNWFITLEIHKIRTSEIACACLKALAWYIISLRGEIWAHQTSLTMIFQNILNLFLVWTGMRGFRFQAEKYKIWPLLWTKQDLMYWNIISYRTLIGYLSLLINIFFTFVFSFRFPSLTYRRLTCATLIRSVIRLCYIWGLVRVISSSKQSYLISHINQIDDTK